MSIFRFDILFRYWYSYQTFIIIYSLSFIGLKHDIKRERKHTNKQYKGQVQYLLRGAGLSDSTTSRSQLLAGTLPLGDGSPGRSSASSENNVGDIMWIQCSTNAVNPLKPTVAIRVQL